jgi:hypothetical protein
MSWKGTICPRHSALASVEFIVKIANTYSNKEKPWYIKHCTEEEVIKGITRPKTCGGYE